MGQFTLDSFTGPAFDPGDRVIDRTPAEASSDAPDVMIVLAPDVGQAKTVTVEGQTVAALNPEYPDDDRVVEVVFRSYLNEYISPWADWESETLRTNLKQFCETWSIEYRTYYYPESRLQAVTA